MTNIPVADATAVGASIPGTPIPGTPTSGPPEPARPAPPSSAPVALGSAVPTRSRIGFGRVLLTAVHLAALGLLGSIVFSVSLGLFTAGVSTALIAGVGLVLLIGLVYLLYGVAWFEVERAEGLYGFGVPPLQLRKPKNPGFGGWLQSIVRQSIDGRMWVALLSFGLGSLFGLTMLWLAQTSALFLFAALSDNDMGVRNLLRYPGAEWMDWTGDPLWSFCLMLLSLSAFIGLAALHAVISRSLLTSPSRSELATAVRAKSAQREGAVRAAEVERTRIERDLHDGVQPRLVSIGMTLGLAQQKIDDDPETAKALVSEAHTSTKAAITELRQLARGIHVSVLDDRGLDAALSALAGRSHIPVHLDVRMDGRPAAQQRGPESPSPFRDAEAAVYFSIAEALTNAAKHSRAAECRVTVRLRDAGTPQAKLWARVEDNGIGGALLQPGGGLDGISNRVLAAGGVFQLDSPQGGPTALEVSVPCAF